MLSVRENYCPDQVTFSGAEPSHPTTIRVFKIAFNMLTAVSPNAILPKQNISLNKAFIAVRDKHTAFTCNLWYTPSK
jgi:hypothetical protein